MKQTLFIAIASIAVITLCFTNCKKKNEDNNASFSMNGTTWAYNIPNPDPNTSTLLPSIGTVTLTFTTDKVSGTVKLIGIENPTTIPATAYAYNESTSKGSINGLDLSGTGFPINLPVVDFTVSDDTKTFTSIALNAALGALGIDNVVFTKQ